MTAITSVLIDAESEYRRFAASIVSCTACPDTWAVSASSSRVMEVKSATGGPGRVRRHRRGIAWNKFAVRAILVKPAGDRPREPRVGPQGRLKATLTR